MPLPTSINKVDYSFDALGMPELYAYSENDLKINIQFNDADIDVSDFTRIEFNIAGKTIGSDFYTDNVKLEAGQSYVLINLKDVGIEAGEYYISLVAYAVGFESGIVIIPDDVDLVEVLHTHNTYIPSPPISPINRTVEWDERKTPELVAGDTFYHYITLKAGRESKGLDICEAESIKCAVVNVLHSVKMMEEIEVVDSEGSAWSEGKILLVLPHTSTEKIFLRQKLLAKLEIQVTINSRKFTWFAPIHLVPGHVS